MDLNLRDIPPELRQDLKIGAALEGKTMRDYVVELLDKALSQLYKRPLKPIANLDVDAVEREDHA